MRTSHSPNDWTEHLLRRIATWVSNAYGFPILASRPERVARLVEEAIELAQAEGLPTEDIVREEVERIEAIPVETLRAKHQAKVEAGTALQGKKPCEPA